MIVRVLWLAILLGLAVVTVSVELDRQSRRNPSLAQHVPEPIRSNAQLAIAALAIDEGSPEIALREARELVKRRPMPAEHLRLLAQAQFAANELDASGLTIQYAAQRGWRDPLAQQSMLQLALAAGDAPEAARRYAALFLNRETEDALLERLGTQVLAEPGGPGRNTLIDIVAGGDRWHAQFLGRGPRILPSDAFSEIVTAVLGRSVTFDCRRLEGALRAISQRDGVAGAQLVEQARDTCPGIGA
jgi:hypothetical protein